jgi:hypothetical protein
LSFEILACFGEKGVYHEVECQSRNLRDNPADV